MTKPEMKRHTAVSYVREDAIHFYAEQAIADEFAGYGALVDLHASGWLLYVDGRFDVAEIADYIRSYTPPVVPDAFRAAIDEMETK